MTEDLQAWLAPVLVGLTLLIVLIKSWRKKKSKRASSCGCTSCDLKTK